MVKMLTQAAELEQNRGERVKKDFKLELTRYGGRLDVVIRKREKLSEVPRFLSYAGTSIGEIGDRASRYILFI